MANQRSEQICTSSNASGLYTGHQLYSVIAFSKMGAATRQEEAFPGAAEKRTDNKDAKLI
jgi:hypothetical protein